MGLDALVTQLQQVHGASLVGIALYGSAASDEHVAGLSDQNILVVVEELDMRKLRALGQTARAWREAGNPPPLTLTRREWLGSADVFPMEYADVLERHRVLAGTLPIDGITVDMAHLRLQVEQEALGKLLRLRRGAMTAGTDIARERELLRASLSAMLVIFRGVIRLHGEAPPKGAAEVITRAAALCRFDSRPFARVDGLVHGVAIADADIESVLDGYLAGAAALVSYLDGYAPLAGDSR